jgi:hypothetical protein
MTTVDSAIQDQVTAVLSLLPPDELGEAMADELLAQMPEMQRSTDADFRTTLVRSCASNVAAAFEVLLGGGPRAPVTPPADAIAFAHELVHRGVGLAALLRAYRLGQWFVHTRVEEKATELQVEPSMRWQVLTHVSNYMFLYVDAISAKLVEDYEAERARWIRGAAAARAELITAMLAGEQVDPVVATEKLRYDVSRNHLAMIVWADGSDPRLDPGALESAAGELAKALGGGPVLTIAIGERVVWAWTSGAALEEAPARDDPLTTHHGVRAAVGIPGEGPTGLVDSHEKAQEARRVAELLAVPDGAVVSYKGVALTSLLTAVPAVAVSFAESELGALAEDSDNAEKLRLTLGAYLEENLSAVRTARRLYVHQNTVVYRVKQAEELLGRPVEERRLELEVALRIAGGLGNLRTHHQK